MVHEIDEEIGSNSHPLTPLGAPAALTQDHDRFPSTEQCGDALWHLKEKTTLLYKRLHNASLFWAGGKLKKGAMEDLSSTRQVITHCFADATI